MLAAFLGRDSRRRPEIVMIEDKDFVQRHAYHPRSFNACVQRRVRTQQIRSTAILQLVCQFPGYIARVRACEDASPAQCAKEDYWEEYVVAAKEEDAVSLLKMLRPLQAQSK